MSKRPAPKISWSEVVRIDALGTDAVGEFYVWLTFTYANGAQIRIDRDNKGYREIVESLPTHFPSIPVDWYREMSQESWHAERVLYARDT